MSEINLIPDYLKNKGFKNLKIKLYFLEATAVIIFLAFYVPYLYVSNLQKQEIDLKSQLQEVSTYSESHQLSNDISYMKSYIDRAESISGRRVTAWDKISQLEKIIPEGLEVIDLKYSSGELIIKGTTKNYNLISDFLKTLQCFDSYRKARITGIDFNETLGSYVFIIKTIIS